jgi:hypothetical protein
MIFTFQGPQTKRQVLVVLVTQYKRDILANILFFKVIRICITQILKMLLELPNYKIYAYFISGTNLVAPIKKPCYYLT